MYDIFGSTDNRVNVTKSTHGDRDGRHGTVAYLFRPISVLVKYFDIANSFISLNNKGVIFSDFSCCSLIDLVVTHACLELLINWLTRDSAD